MDIIDIVEYLTEPIFERKEIFKFALNRGQGSQIHIEKWILIEMGPKLIELKNKGVLEEVECERDYPKAKTEGSKRREKADIWLNVNGQEHFLEVKTIHATNQKRNQIKSDLEKRQRLNNCIFYHLTFSFPIKKIDLENEEEELHDIYNRNEMDFVKNWELNLWDNKKLLISLYQEEITH